MLIRFSFSLKFMNPRISITLLAILITIIHPSQAIIGNFTVSVDSREIHSYMKFGFLSGGSVLKQIKMTTKDPSVTFLLFFICDEDYQSEIVAASNNNQLCMPGSTGNIMKMCSYQSLIFNREDNTYILPFKNGVFAERLIFETFDQNSAKNAKIDLNDNRLKDDDIIKKVINKNNDQTIIPKASAEQIIRQNDLITKIATRWALYENKSVASETSYINYTKFFNHLSNQIYFDIKYEGMYLMVLLNCMNQADLDIDFKLLNPNGEHLSVGELENKIVYKVMIAAWSALFAFWLVTWIRNMVLQRKSYPLHYFFLFSGLLWSSYTILEEGYWKTYSRNGIPSLELRVTSSVIRGISYSLNLALFLYIGKGYTYLNFVLSPKDKREIKTLVILNNVINWFYEFFGSNILILFSTLFLYIFCGRLIMFDFRKNLRRIKLAIAAIAQDISNSPSPTVPREGVTTEAEQPINPQATAVNTDRNQVLPLDEEQEELLLRNRNIVLLTNKIKIINLMIIFIMSHLLLLCLFYVVSEFIFEDKLYESNIWVQILLTMNYLAFTWLFNCRYTQAFTYPIGNDTEESVSYEPEPLLQIQQYDIDTRDLLKIVNDACYIENATKKGSFQIGYKVSMEKKPKQFLSSSAEKKKPPKKSIKYITKPVQEIPAAIPEIKKDDSREKDPSKIALENISMRIEGCEPLDVSRKCKSFEIPKDLSEDTIIIQQKDVFHPPNIDVIDFRANMQKDETSNHEE